MFSQPPGNGPTRASITADASKKIGTRRAQRALNEGTMGGSYGCMPTLDRNTRPLRIFPILGKKTELMPRFKRFTFETTPNQAARRAWASRPMPSGDWSASDGVLASRKNTVRHRCCSRTPVHYRQQRHADMRWSDAGRSRPVEWAYLDRTAHEPRLDHMPMFGAPWTSQLRFHDRKFLNDVSRMTPGCATMSALIPFQQISHSNIRAA